MPTLNDLILSVTGGPSVNEGLFAYFGGTGTTLQERERAWLAARVTPQNSIEDMWFDYLYNVRGYPGTRNDMELRFWLDGGAVGPPSVLTKDYTAVWAQFAVSVVGYRLSPAGGSLSPDNLFDGVAIAQIAVDSDDLVYVTPNTGLQFPSIVPPNLWLRPSNDEFGWVTMAWDVNRYTGHFAGAYAQAQANIGLPLRIRLSGDLP